jgi:hypothetical protein
MNLIAMELVTGGLPFSTSSPLWANSLPRTFLNNATTGNNGGFLGQAFTTEQRNAIRNISVPNNTGSVNTPGDGTPTTDRIWLPSHYELIHASGMFRGLFPSTQARRARASDWALANNTLSFNNFGHWWTRSFEQRDASEFAIRFVFDAGEAATQNHNVPQAGVRPAFSLAL